MPRKLSANEIEAANRSEASALLIRCGYRVYRPEADTDGEDLVLRTPADVLIAVQLKGRLTIDWKRYGGTRLIWMLFPDAPFQTGVQREWYLVPHAQLFAWMKQRHGHTPKWNDTWSVRSMSRLQRDFLEAHRIRTAAREV